MVEMKTEKLQAYVLILIIIGAILILTSIPYTPVNSIYNHDWNGTSDFADTLQDNQNMTVERLLVSPIILNSKKDIKIMVIVGSDRKYTQAEQLAYRNFVERGGALVLFEDFGPARAIAEQFGIQYLKGTLRETSFEFSVNRPSQIFVQDLFTQIFYPGHPINPLIVGEAAAVIDSSWVSPEQSLDVSTTLPLLVTFPSAFLDRNNNGALDSGDYSFEYGIPLGLYKSIGNGSITVIGDASIPLNQYWGLKERFINPLTSELTQITVSNAFWCTALMWYLTKLQNSTSVVFDESHQAVSFTSAAGIFNLIAGTWVGLINTSIIALSILTISALGTSINMRSRLRKAINKRRNLGRLQTLENHQFISHPTLAERQISEQFILYNIMGDNYIHIANMHLIEQIEKIRKGPEFINSLRAEYGNDLRMPNSFDRLLELHQKLQDFIEENKNRLL